MLLIACSNVAGLTLNRALGRPYELTLRGALGAGRGRLIRQLVTESLLLAVIGGALGIFLSKVALELTKDWAPASIPHLNEVTFDWQVMLFALAAIPEHPRPAGAPSPFASYSFASPDYFRAIGTPLLRGRGFSDHDTLNATPVTIINSAMAKKYWPGEDPVGKQVGVGLTKYRARVIVGVIGDIKHDSLREEPSPEMIVPYTQNEIKTWPSMQTMQYAVRTKMEPAAIGDSLRGALHEVDPDLPMAKFTTLTTLVNDSLAADRLAMTLIGSFGVMALILVAIGMFGVISCSVAQRTREIGLRVALGAKRTEIFTMVMGQAARLACVGIGIGVVAALATTRLMARFLYGVQPTVFSSFFVVAGRRVASLLHSSA